MSSSNIKTIQTHDTEWAADSIEWCPSENYQNFFVCGTYQLLGSKTNDQDDSTPLYNRQGRLYLAKFSPEIEQFEIVDMIPTMAILDIQWMDFGDDVACFSAANSLGIIEVFKIVDEELQQVTTVAISEWNDVLALSLDWSRESKMITSDSKGNINLFAYQSGQFTNIHTWLGHGFEAWTCAFDRNNSDIVYSGGDDSFLKIFDIRAETPQLHLQNRSHTAGVTSLLSFSQHEYMLATGSYDEILRIFDTRIMKHPISECNLKGGIWRIKPNPHRSDNILCACMYHNFSVVQYDDSFNNLSIIGEYFEHGSICYGCDWSHMKHEKENSFYFATCSMYDHKLNLSEIEIEK